MIGVDPVVFRTQTAIGPVDLQIWITALSGSAINRLVLPFYYAGARKYLFMCSTKHSVKFVSDIIDLVLDHLNALNEIIIILPSKGLEVKYSQLKKEFEVYFKSKTLRNFSFKRWTTPSDLATLFEGMTNDLALTFPQEVGFAPIGFEIEIVEDIIKQQGFDVQNHEVVVPKGDIYFRVNLEKNTVHVEMIDDESSCKVSKKLCIIIADKGYANMNGLGDLRLLSILYAINDESIFSIKGQSKTEDVSYQIDQLRKSFEECKEKKKIAAIKEGKK